MGLYSEKLETLIRAAFIDGELTDKERQILMKKAEEEGIDLDEFEMVLNAKVAELEATKQKQSQKPKHGTSKKCPCCGAIVSPTTALCPDCGYEFAGVEAVASMKRFLDEIRRARRSEDYDEEANVVENYPIPQSRSDLLEFMMVLKPRLKNDDEGCYWSKYEECVNRANTLFPNDPLFLPYISNFTEKKKEHDTEGRKNERELSFGPISFLGTPILVICLGIAEWSLLDIGWGWKLIIALLGCPILAILIMKLIKLLYVR